MNTGNTPRAPRYKRELLRSGAPVHIPAHWDDLSPVPRTAHDPALLAIAVSAGIPRSRLTIPLIARYRSGRPWSHEELASAYEAWSAGASITLIAAALNRSPQDIIYRLLDECTRRGVRFTETNRTTAHESWKAEDEPLARELYERGVAAWRIAVLLRVDFGVAEKRLSSKRSGYGHKKLNPFAINTEHKLWLNDAILGDSQVLVHRALDSFAGQGYTTSLMVRHFPSAEIHAVDCDGDALAVAKRRVQSERVRWWHGDNRTILPELQKTHGTFDLIDLDPFVSCADQLPLALPLLSDHSLLFVTFGGEYRRSFIGSNRSSIHSRYGFDGSGLSNTQYLEEVPHYFAGHLHSLLRTRRLVATPLAAVRYANICRFWFEVRRTTTALAERHFRSACNESERGTRWNGTLRRFREIRSEFDKRSNTQLTFLK